MQHRAPEDGMLVIVRLVPFSLKHRNVAFTVRANNSFTMYELLHMYARVAMEENFQNASPRKVED